LDLIFLIKKLKKCLKKIEGSGSSNCKLKKAYIYLMDKNA